MSKRAKNAGLGYGFIFHGGFSTKKDAEKKERETKGSFIRGIPTNRGYRYFVMSPRENPIKRKPRNPVVFDAGLGLYSSWKRTKHGTVYGTGHTKKQALTDLRDRLRRARKGEPLGAAAGYFPGSNPMDLAIMGANPAENPRSIFLRPGEQVTITSARRHNPIVNNPSGRICGKLIGGLPCSREPGHRGPHLPQGATLRPASRHNWGGRRGNPVFPNPTAAETREAFIGAPVHRIDSYREPMPAGDYALLGQLLTLYVKPLTGGQVIEISPADVQVVADSAGRIWFLGEFIDENGDRLGNHLEDFGAREHQAGLWEIGQARRIDYRQKKEHVPHPENDEWKHHFGEQNGIRPKVFFDVKMKRLLLEGGDYKIEARGIVN